MLIVHSVESRSTLEFRFFDYHVRELPGDDIKETGEGVEVAADGK